MGSRPGLWSCRLLYLARDVLIPITLAVFLTFFLAPIVKLLQRARLPKVAAVAVSVVLALAIILLVGGIIGAQLKSLVADAHRNIQRTVINKYETLYSTINGLAKQVTGRLGPAYKASERAPGAPGDAQPDQPPVPVVVQNSSSGYLETGRLILEPILSPLSTLAIVLIVTIFVLVRQEDLRDRLIRLFGSNDLHRTTLAIDDATQRLTRYFLTQAAINSQASGVLIGFWSISLIGLPEAQSFGDFSRRYCDSVPYVGAITAAVLPVALAAAVDPGWSMALWTAGLFIVAEGVTRPNPGAGAIWQQHRPISDGSGYRRHFLELDLGTDRSYPVDASDALPGCPGSPRPAPLSSLTCFLGDRPALTPVGNAPIRDCSPAIRTKSWSKRMGC